MLDCGHVSSACVRWTCVALALTAGASMQATLAGDLSSFAGAAAYVGYLTIGRKLRAWMPVFIFTFPVTGTPSHIAFLGQPGRIIGVLLFP